MDDWHIVLGVRETWGQKQPLVLPPRDRRHHLYTIGKSGTGKTTLLRNLIVQDICAGNGVGVIDPHGDLATEPLALQKEFGKRVTEIRELEASQATSRTHLEALYQSMLHRAFTGRL